MIRTKKIVLIVTFLLMIMGCRYTENKNQFTATSSKDLKIQDSLKLNFLNEILGDTNNILRSRKTLITHYNIVPKLDYFIPNADSLKSGTMLEYLSYHLKETDTIFLKNQISHDIDFNLKELSKQNFRIFDLKTHMENGITYDSILELAEERNKKNNIDSDLFLMIKGPIFNKKLNRAYLKVDSYHYGNEFLFIKKNDSWSKRNIGYWVE